jgi:predicted AlkP superfamily pyrophosphatase or phosphodiesterase
MQRCLIATVTLLILTLCGASEESLASPTATPVAPLLILVSIDGYRADYLDRGHSPVLASLAADGVRAKGLRPVYPTITYPNHYTLVTGLYPDEHGMVNNTMHDPVLGSFSPPNRAANTDGRWWEQAEPIWVTAQNQGLRTASMYWPGTQAEIRGGRPTYWKDFDATVTPEARVAQVLAWLDLPEDQRPAFVSLYFDQVDTAGHSYGPDSKEVNDALVSVDAAMGQLIEGLRQRNAYTRTNLVLVADHGMASSSPDRMLLLDDLVNLDHVDVTTALVNLGLDPKPGYEKEVEHALLQTRHPHLQCWKKDQMPRKFHYGKNARIPSIQCVTDDGWMISAKALEAKRSHPILGEHGYDNDDPLMRALFVAHGPSFKQHLTVPVFDNINVYVLLTKLLGVEPQRNDGKLAVTAGMLRLVALP